MDFFFLRCTKPAATSGPLHVLLHLERDLHMTGPFPSFGSQLEVHPPTHTKRGPPWARGPQLHSLVSYLSSPAPSEQSLCGGLRGPPVAAAQSGEDRTEHPSHPQRDQPYWPLDLRLQAGEARAFSRVGQSIRTCSGSHSRPLWRRLTTGIPGGGYPCCTPHSPRHRGSNGHLVLFLI